MDTVQPNAAGTQGWNVYAYAGGNPVRWMDPSGHNTGETTIVWGDSAKKGPPLGKIGAALFTLYMYVACVIEGKCWATHNTIADNTSQVEDWRVRPVTVGGGGGWTGPTEITEVSLPLTIGGVDFGGFPPRKGPDNDPNKRKMCVTDLIGWLVQNGFSDVKQTGPHELTYTNPNDPDGLQVIYKPEGANPATTGPSSEGPRIQVRLPGHNPSMYNPYDGQWYSPATQGSHLQVDNAC